MSYDDAFGPADPAILERTERNAAIKWVRASIFSRSAGNPHRSRLACAVMYLAELDAGDFPAEKRPKLEAARAELERLAASDLAAVIATCRAAENAAPTSLSRSWAARAAGALERSAESRHARPAAPAGPSRRDLERAAERRLEASSPEYAADLARFKAMPRDAEGRQELCDSLLERTRAEVEAAS